MMSDNSQLESSYKVLQNEDIQEPKQYKVIILNDNYTPKDFVIEVLIAYFNKSSLDAQLITEQAHTTGSALAGVYPYDIAITKANLTRKLARENGFPFRCIVHT